MPPRYLGNNNTMEIHDLENQKTNCQINEILEEHKVWFNTLADAEAAMAPGPERYDGCKWCMIRYHTD